MLIRGFEIAGKLNKQRQNTEVDKLEIFFHEVYKKLKQNIAVEKLVSYPDLLNWLCKLAILITNADIKA